MGIRVHKFLGYGLADVDATDRGIVDARINPDSPLLAYQAKADEYTAWLNQLREKGEFGEHEFNIDLFPRKEGERLDMWDTFAYSPEYGLPNVLVLKPLSMKDWARYDDAIDYVQETELHYFRDGGEPQANRVDMLPHGIFPYNGLYMDKRTGERLKDEVLWWVRLQSSTEPVGETAREMLAETLNLTVEEAMENIVPVVPFEIRRLAEFAELFTNPEVWKQLRPMLYTYWS